MKIYVGQIEVQYNYNPYGKYYNLWFYCHNKCVFVATLFNRDLFIESIHEVGECLRYGKLQTFKGWIPGTDNLIIEGREWIMDNIKRMINNIYGLAPRYCSNRGYIHLWQLYVLHKPSPDKMGECGAYLFYIDRLFASLNYGEHSGMEIVKTVCRCAFADEVLTDAESISIINLCHSPEWHKIFMEVNYNEGWN